MVQFWIVMVFAHLGTIAAIDVTLSPTAIVKGEIEAEGIQIDFGAQVEGRLTAKGEAKN